MDSTTAHAPASAANSTLTDDAEQVATESHVDALEDEMLVEEISIDGMCGVY